MSVSNIALHTRQKLVEVMESEYVLFARARGETGRTILRRHGLRNILLPALTAEAGLNSDVPLLLGITLFSTLFVCVGNLIANLLYGVVDPRMKEARP